MSTPCGIFWDMQTIHIPKKSSADIVVSLIKTKIFETYDLKKIDFYVAGSFNTIKPETVSRLKSLGADFEEAEPGRNVADEKIKQRMLRFIARFNRKCTIILITSDTGIGKPLKEIQRNLLLKLYFIRLDQCFGEELTEIADRVFLLKPSSLELVYEKSNYQTVDNQSTPGDIFSEFRKKYFVKITCDKYFSSEIFNEIRNDISSYGGSFAIITSKDDIWCSFDEISDARSALDLKGQYTHKSQVYNIDVSIQPPTQEVINLMECAKLSNSPLVRNQRKTLNMPQYKPKSGNSGDRRASGSSNTANPFGMRDLVETINNMSGTYNNIQSIYSLLNPSKSDRSNRPSNSRSNDDGCKQS